ncbi:MAG: hypothetical protein WAQ25_03110 [Candidatus Saccharimonas sp.]
MAAGNHDGDPAIRASVLRRLHEALENVSDADRLERKRVEGHLANISTRLAELRPEIEPRIDFDEERQEYVDGLPHTD